MLSNCWDQTSRKSRIRKGPFDLRSLLQYNLIGGCTNHPHKYHLIRPVIAISIVAGDVQPVSQNIGRIVVNAVTPKGSVSFCLLIEKKTNR